MLYTKTGDDGKTGLFGCDQKMSKSSKIAEALGALDELNSFLGICKIKAGNLSAIISDAQQDLFIVQAELAGADKKLELAKTEKLEQIIADVEKEIPPINNFVIAGGTELSAMFDFARTIARRAERRVVAVNDEGIVAVASSTLAYLNRLSSLFYALARVVNVRAGIKDESPQY